jgi:aminopeptidase-like protein
MIMDLLKFCEDLYEIPRSLTGKGVVKTLEYIQGIIPINIKQVKSGTKVFDWTVPPEWNIRDGYVIELSTGKKVIDFKSHNLHVLGYSKQIDDEVSFEDLEKNLYYLKDQPDAIPYITSYYSKRWGFCLSFNDFKKLDRNSRFKVFIDSEFKDDGNLTYGELIIKGKVDEEIFFSSYVCHPQMVNNELSGPSVLTGIAESLLNKDNYYSYRFVLIPETIGSIVYLSEKLDVLKKNVIGGYNISCVGDERNWGLVPSRYGNNLSDRIAEHTLKEHYPDFIKYSWLDRGSDERQYCSPGVDLPISSITRTKFGEYPEYHTSLDNFDVVTEKGLNDSLLLYLKCVDIFEKNRFYPKVKVFCEPQLGKRGLYPNISTKESGNIVRNMMNFISYCDGSNSILEISEICGIDFEESFGYYTKMKENGLME